MNSNYTRGIIFLIVILIGAFFSVSKSDIIQQKLNKELSLHFVAFKDSSEEKQKGIHIFGHLDSLNLQPFVQNNYEWITLVPFSDQKDFDSPNLIYLRGDSLQKKERSKRWKHKIGLAHEVGLKVFIKPHIWLHDPSESKWRSDIYPSNDNNWELWKENYRDFILFYAKIAEQNNVEMFCVGAELTRLTTEKTDFWRALIQDVREVYSGKITYAANWYKEYEKINFWEDLDFIGIQAYFPLVKNEYPSVEQISEGWQKHLNAIEAVHNKYNRKVIFTEMGYKSTSDSAVRPWEWVSYTSTNEFTESEETQAHCYQSFFNTVWNKEWLAGAHIWQARSDFVKGRGKSSLDFTPQGKSAEKIIAKGFE